MQNQTEQDAFPWGDGPWLARRAKLRLRSAPLNIYEMHLGSWRRTGEGAPLSCREIAQWLVPYVKRLGFTHVHLLPVAGHHPEDIWGYRCTDPWSLDGRCGTPEEFMYLVDQLHRAGIGVFLDWVCPALPEDQLTSCALSWLDTFHLDGLRPVCAPDGAAPPPPEWLRERLTALRPGVCVMQEPGLHWVNPCVRADLTQAPIFALSHDEVTHGNGSLLSRMPGSSRDKSACLRAFYTFLLALPGKTLIMMGSEFGQWNQWCSEQSLDWHLLDQQDADGELHRQLQAFFRAANDLYLRTPALWQLDGSPGGFRPLYQKANVYVFLRTGRRGGAVLAAVNLSSAHRDNLSVGVPRPGQYTEIFRTDRAEFGGDGRPAARVHSDPIPRHGMEQSLTLDLPPMSAVLLNCP